MQKQRDVKGVEKKGLKDQVMESLPEPRGEPGAYPHPTEEVYPPHLPCRMGTRIGLISERHRVVRSRRWPSTERWERRGKDSSPSREKARAQTQAE